jgi:hypothetical protein
MTREEFKQTEIGKFVIGLTLCDHMGDVASDIEYLLTRMNVEIDSSDWEELSDLHSLFYDLDSEDS